MRKLLFLLLMLLTVGAITPTTVHAAYPVVAGTCSSTDTSLDTSYVIGIGTCTGGTWGTTASGDLLVCSMGGSGTDGTPNTLLTGWTLEGDKVYGSNVGHLAVFTRIADGTEGNTVTATGDQAEGTASVCYRITGHAGSSPEISIGVTGVSTSPDPATVTASWGALENLFIAIGGGRDINQDFTAYPANYTGSNLTVKNGTQGSGAAMGTRNLTAATDDPGVFTVDASARWGTFTLVVRPVSAGGGGNPRVVGSGIFD